MYWRSKGESSLLASLTEGLGISSLWQHMEGLNDLEEEMMRNSFPGWLKIGTVSDYNTTPEEIFCEGYQRRKSD